jgi:hypothetical protein
MKVQKRAKATLTEDEARVLPGKVGQASPAARGYRNARRDGPPEQAKEIAADDPRRFDARYANRTDIRRQRKGNGIGATRSQRHRVVRPYCQCGVRLRFGRSACDACLAIAAAKAVSR